MTHIIENNNILLSLVEEGKRQDRQNLVDHEGTSYSLWFPFHVPIYSYCHKCFLLSWFCATQITWAKGIGM